MFLTLVPDGRVTEINKTIKRPKTQSPPRFYVAREIAIRVHPPFSFWFCSSEHKSTAPLVSIVGSRPASVNLLIAVFFFAVFLVFRLALAKLL